MTLAEWFADHPNQYREWDTSANSHISPAEDGYAVNKKTWWICEKGHRYEMYVFSRTLDGQGCPYCAGKKTLAGFNDLATKRPDVLKKWDYEKNTEVSPQDVTECSHRMVFWKCEKGHSWQARVQSITMLKEGSSGCPYCNGKLVIAGQNDLASRFPELMKEWDYNKNEISPEKLTAGSKKKVFWTCSEGHSWQTAVFARTRGNGTGCPVCRRRKK